MSNSTDDTRGPGEKAPAAPRKTPLAVALHYEVKTDLAPRVVASGRGSVAEQILEIAFANDVKVREDSDLAELLSQVDVESEIPLEALAAVAEILAYVYRANGDVPPGGAPSPLEPKEPTP